MSQSIPSLSPILELATHRVLPSFSFALHATIVHALSLIMAKLSTSSISSAGKALIKSYLFA
jgi:hypothetical protein